MEVKRTILWRVYGVTLLLVLAAITIFMQAVRIQVVQGDHWRAQADSLYLSYQPVKAHRGNIYATDGSLIASSLQFYEIRMDTRTPGLTNEIWERNIDSLAHHLAFEISSNATLAEHKRRLNKARRTGNRYFLIKRNASYPEVEKMRKFPIFNLGATRGGYIEVPKPKRKKPFGVLASRTIGHARTQSQSVGLEAAYNEALSGTAGQRLMQRISGGFYIPVNDLSEIEPKNGLDVVSALDMNLQDIVEESLHQGLKRHRGTWGTAILMEVATGKIRAIANLEINSDGLYYESFNHAIGSSIEPGSTFKLASTMALLEDGLAKPDDAVNLNKGKKRFHDRDMYDSSPHGLNWTSLRKSFEISSNVGIASLIQSNYGSTKKADKFIGRLKQMHLHQTLGVEIQGEGKPFIKEAYSNKWYGTTLPWMSTGYELQLTPLQVLTLYNTVANGGRMMKPQFVEEIQELGETIEKFDPVVVEKQMLSEQTIRTAQKLLEGVVERGTAKDIQPSHYKIAGKTGTSITNYMKIKPGVRKIYRASFAGYFPADKPIYSCLVMIHDPKEDSRFGSSVAAPIFREISDKCYATTIRAHRAVNEKAVAFEVKRLPNYQAGQSSELGKILAFAGVPFQDDSESPWSVIRPGKEQLLLSTRRVGQEGVPSVIGMGLRDAIYLLENKGLKVKYDGVGRVTKQSIKPGTKQRNETITLTLG